MSIFTSKKVEKFLIKIQLTKSDLKRTRGWKVPCLMAIRVKRQAEWVKNISEEVFLFLWFHEIFLTVFRLSLHTINQWHEYFLKSCMKKKKILFRILSQPNLEVSIRDYTTLYIYFQSWEIEKGPLNGLGPLRHITNYNGFRVDKIEKESMVLSSWGQICFKVTFDFLCNCNILTRDCSEKCF